MIARGIEVEADSRRQQHPRLRHDVRAYARQAGRRERVRQGVVLGRVVRQAGDVGAHTGRHGEPIVHSPLVLTVQAVHADVEVRRNIRGVLAVRITDGVPARSARFKRRNGLEGVHPVRALREIVEDVREVETAAHCEGVRALGDRDVVHELEDLLLEQVVRRKLLGAKRHRTHGPAHVDAHAHLGRLHRHSPFVVNRAVAYDQLVGQTAGEIGVQLAGRGAVLRHCRELVRAEPEPGVLIQRRVVVRGDVA